MQNRYVADVGDYVKLAILRRLGVGLRLGVVWWLYPDEGHNADGKHVIYRDRAPIWREFDPPLFDALRGAIARGDRSVLALQELNVLGDAVYFPEQIPLDGGAAARRVARLAWFARAEKAVATCNFVFLDPDNGLETRRFDPGRSKAGKSVALSELAALRKPGRALLVYHHHTRMVGGNIVELGHWGERLSTMGFRVDAIRASVGTARAFFLLDAPAAMRDAAAGLVRDWPGKMTWHPDLG